jgi:PhzF family phenazine biosynthesis protein
MQLSIYQVDAFTDRLFGGNPAAICPLNDWLPDATMQAIAAENNLAETAFFVPEGAGYALRWFTPTTEVDLCGHATLASAHVIFSALEPSRDSIAFRTLKAGILTVKRENNLLAMDFPARPPAPVTPSPELAAAIGQKPAHILAARDLVAVYDRAADVAALAPDFAALAKLPYFALTATAPGDGGIDYVLRFFAPAQGIPEDPATGSAHCTLVPYWANRLGKSGLQAQQISPRGGRFTCMLNSDRVVVAGRAVLYLRGEITV